jgi:hypothetical protein
MVSFKKVSVIDNKRIFLRPHNILKPGFTDMCLAGVEPGISCRKKKNFIIH